MPKFILLLHEDPSDFGEMSPEEMQKVIEKYSAWSDGLAEAGHLLGGDKLKDGEGQVLLPAEGAAPRILDGPYSEAKEVIGGYFKIEAESLQSAAQLAADCPHLEFGGKVEVREIDEV